MSNLEVAETILSQLGGSRFLAMTGASHLVGGDRFLQMHLPRMSKASAIRIMLMPDDTYSIQAFRGRGFKIAPYGLPLDMIYADNLRSAFKSITGMDTNL